VQAAIPFLKWAGGKGQLLQQFEALYPASRKGMRYLEPFVGAGAVFFRVRHVLQPTKVFLWDTNAELINVWKCLQDDAEAVIAALERHAKDHSQEHYYAVRARQPEALTTTEQAARLVYLNRTCFNGLYRVNSRNVFNVPFGRYKNPRIVDAENLRLVSEALTGAQIGVQDFRATAKVARKGDFVYLDPPYDPVSETAKFTSYTKGSFGREDQEELAALYRELDRRGCLVMLSNSNTLFVRELYRGFDVRTDVMARRSINSQADKRGLVSEVVVLNYVPPPFDAQSGDPQRGGSLAMSRHAGRAGRRRSA
jgi:DNA adenine methylase